jgi:hypothetical protein
VNLDQQVVSLDLAKRLKELGVKQESFFKWIKANHPTEACAKPAIQYNCTMENYDNTLVHDNWTLTSWAAFTVAEIGKMLPRHIIQNDIEYYYTQLPTKHLDKWIIFYRNTFSSWDGQDQEDANEANCRAKMLIYLLENKLCEIPKCDG